MEWSACLCRHLFGTDRAAGPVAFVPATRFDLRRAVADPSADAAEVEWAFVRAVRTTPERTRRLLSPRSPEFVASWLSDDPPAYLAHLVLTCYVAAGGEEGTLDEGRFRERLRRTLGHPEGTTYDLPNLGLLWEAFAAWLEVRASAGNLRPLRLPDPGRMSRIGYSLRLAFPTLRDRRILADAFADLRGDVPSTRAAVERVRGLDFGERSQVPSVTDDFIRHLRRGDPHVHGHPFWTAVRDAVALDYASPSEPRLRLALVVDEPAALDLSCLLACGELPAGWMPPPRVWIEPLAARVGGFERAIHFDGGPGPVQALLDGRAGSRWTPLGRTALARAASEGAVLLARDESGWPVSRLSLPDPGTDVWVLARRQTLAAVLRVAAVAPRPRSSAYEGWDWVGPLDAEAFCGVSDQLPKLSVFQRSVPPPAVRLVGGVRTGAAYLGVPGALPAVSAPSGARVVREEPDGRQVALRPASGGRYYDPDDAEPIGLHRYEAAVGGRHVGSTSARFVAAHVGVDYRAPGGGPWYVESSHAELEVWGDPPETTEEGASTERVADFSVLVGGRSAVVPDAQPVRELAPFVEVVAALSTTRAGLPEGEFVRLLASVLGVPGGPLLWDVARAWVEAGHLDLLAPNAWPNRRYVARRPALVIWPEERRTATLVGLAPAEVRDRIASHAGRLGVEVHRRTRHSPWVPDLPTVRAPSEASLAELARIVDLPSPVAASPFRAAAPSAVVRTAPIDLPRDLVSQGVWSWAYGGFGHHAGGDVSVSRWTHPRRAPAYAVESGGERRVFRTRTWAFLYATALRGEHAFSADAGGRLVTTGPVRLPVPLARALAVVAGAPGPFADSAGQSGYAIPCVPAAQTALVDWLSETRKVPQRASLHARRLAQLAASSAGPTMPISSVIRNRLRPFDHDPDVRRLLSLRVPVPLTAHVARLADDLAARR
ncbi:hypothetical protein [Rubrivirga marina]|uniref:Uncharacterized protein n=1 Tax=Rubrivirga marina TaxID=1196024 RepID=A0A271ITW3_9BACT|nr:hypothetical protein [Rubrivirga marina]PAP74165.1 hypothetical protein BSZ37_21105 [Rubrivirga marina]